VSVLDFVSRCAQALDEGNWHYLWNKAGQLAHAAEQLDQVAGENWTQVRASWSTRMPSCRASNAANRYDRTAWA
jgi:hypothetical protein